MEAPASVLSSSNSSLSSSNSSVLLPSSFSTSYTKPHFNCFSFSAPNNATSCPKFPRLFFSLPRPGTQFWFRASASILRPSALVIEDEEVLDKPSSSVGAPPLSSATPREMLPKIDKSGRFCSPRAARELALLILYASCLEGSDPVRLFERRVNSRREPGYEFDKESLAEYNHMSFGGPPITTDTLEEADELLRNDQKESDIEAEILSAPPKLVYSKLILRFTRKLLVAVAEKWDCHVHVIDKVAPHTWKNEPAGRILELSILHLAMSEIAVLGTAHQIVINEAVDLAKRFCDGAAPRIINGCLRTFIKDFKGAGETEASTSR